MKKEPKKKAPRFPDWFQTDAIVEITGNKSNHGFSIGEKVRVGTGSRCEYSDGRDWWHVHHSDCTPA